MKVPSKPDVILFDFDGVLIDSAAINADAFVQIYSGETVDKREAVRVYHRENGDVGRRDKFIYYETMVFGRKPSAEAIDDLCEQFAGIVDRALLKVPMIPGVLDAISVLYGRAEMHIVSGMPHKELVNVVIARGLAPYFASMVGSPTTKLGAFTAILDSSHTLPGRCLVIGGSRTEYLAARRLGIPFLAVGPGTGNGAFPRGVPAMPDLVGLSKHLGFGSLVVS